MNGSGPWTELDATPRLWQKWSRFARRQDQKLHAFLQLDPELGRSEAAAGGSLAGIPFAVKDNIAVQGFRLTCGSRLLEGFVSPYTATAVQRLQAQGAVVAGKTNLDEFGMGSSTENSALGRTRNPWDVTRVPGGSSGGSAAAVAAGIVPFALGSDTGGSVRQPASFCGVYGLKPTYGSVSRYGLVAYASSLEVIGVIARSVANLRSVFSVMRGEDPKDQSSAPYQPLPGGSGELRVGIPALGSVALHGDVSRSWEHTASSLRELGFRTREIALPSLEYVVAAYYVIACAEASANLARFDGIRYGARAEELSGDPEKLVRLSRSRGLGPEVKLRILLGTFVLRSGFQEQYYLRAQKIRTLIRQDFERAFGDVQLILMPVYPCPPFKIGGEGLDAFTQKLSDIFTCSANLAGLPALSFPATVENGLPIGMQLLAPAFGEELLFRACERIAELLPVPPCPMYSESWGG
jgi:aspartyl-tRNA(Asn)/glutamyl-tRNA(Gln) amidotransferase subunit A